MVVVVPDSNNAHAKKCPYHHHRTTYAKNAEDNDITITNNDGKQDKQNSTEDERATGSDDMGLSLIHI